MSQADEAFFTSVGCMDGRVQEPVAAFGRKKFGCRFADTITEAGLAGLLAKKDLDQNLLDNLKFKIVDVSLGKHHSKGIIVHGHAQCAGNPVSDETHKEDIKKAAEVLRSFVPENTKIIAVFVKREANMWVVEEL